MDWPWIEPEPICVGHVLILNVFEGKSFAEELAVIYFYEDNHINYIRNYK